MRIIYKPTGSAKEYADLALNIYKGCTHRCKYCYCAESVYVDKDVYFSTPSPKTEVVEKIKKDCESLIKKYNGAKNVPEILMSFMGDVYQPVEEQLGLTRFAIEVLTDFNLKFTILTKGGMRAERDFDLVQGYPDFRLGISLSVIDDAWVKMYEPGAAPPEERVWSATVAKKYGIKTWCSLEPIIDPQQALWILKEWHDAIDHWFLGKMTTRSFKSDYVQWADTRDILCEYLESINASYTVKKSLKEAS